MARMKYLDIAMQDLTLAVMQDLTLAVLAVWGMRRVTE